ncbi:hypothetical protein GPECTOR_61g860 [Gonium pectorale]|uniref:N-acetyltransferase domain-containing protein n=1 Tax=Gonium pectorale TaxID=33097 RepID=A0A150G4X8_GONPE|nr:hypothetical protein GPECTOR_61g860 [Gonium pectorale]|eukprot:KXZ44907.1 hypothetical protein GPECTOR_61g860 [Gonium pectorale]
MIKERTTGSSEYGFKAVDVDLTWDELSRPNYLALGAFAEQDGARVPVAFLVGEICAAEGGAPAPAAAAAAQGAAAATTSGCGGGASAAAPLRVGREELRAAMSAAGCRRRGDLAVAVWYVGVSYEYRRQGLGSGLLDLAREVGTEAGCKAMWLHVADYNPNAIAFYTSYGFSCSPEVYKQGDRGRHLLMHMALEQRAGQQEAEATGAAHSGAVRAVGEAGPDPPHSADAGR